MPPELEWLTDVGGCPAVLLYFHLVVWKPWLQPALDNLRKAAEEVPRRLERIETHAERVLSAFSVPRRCGSNTHDSQELAP